MPHNRASSLSQRPQRVSSTPQETFVNHQTFSLESRRANKGKSQIIRTSTHEVSFVLANSRPIALQTKHRFSLHYRKTSTALPQDSNFPFPFSILLIYLFYFPISFLFIYCMGNTPICPKASSRPFLSLFIFMENSHTFLSPFFSIFKVNSHLITFLFFSHGELSPHHFVLFLIANSRPITFPISHGELSPHHFPYFSWRTLAPSLCSISHSELSPHHFSLFLMANSRPITFPISHGELSPHHFSFLFPRRTHAPSLSISHGELSPHCSFFFFFFSFW